MSEATTTPEPEPEFNPHHQRTSNGVLIVRGLRVMDYNRDIGVVETDHTSPVVCQHNGCHGDHWFEVSLDKGGTSFMNGTRLLSIGGAA